MSDLYEILGIDSSANDSDIKKAYRRLALRYHPDKVSEEERIEAEIKFKEISHAYEVLSDETKRNNYDMYGTDEAAGFNGGAYNGSDNPFDNFFTSNGPEFTANDFSNFFSGMNNNSPKKSKKTEDAVLNVDVTLEDLYKGKTIRSTSTRNVICKRCEGRGGKKAATPKACGNCEGHGYVTKISRVGPGLVSQQKVICTKCEGSGKVYRTKDYCKKCQGKRVIEETKILEFVIEKGCKSNDSVVLKGESDEYPGKETGDVILKFTCKDHSTFKRKGDDLYTKFKIPLVDALCGFSKIVTKHLDGRDIKISTPQGKVIKPGDFLKIKNEGMPIKKSSWFTSKTKGDLYIEIEIEFPKDNWYLEKNDLLKLRNVLPGDRKLDESEVLQENVELITDFTLVNKNHLPEYKEQESNGHTGYEYEDYEYESPQPECRQQ